jgi:hypothetical protein
MNLDFILRIHVHLQIKLRPLMFLISRNHLVAAILALSTLFTLPISAQRQRQAPPPREKVAEGQLIPPATPLVACDPYFSIWSPADKLTDKTTTHWTGKPHPLVSTVLIDGEIFRIMGTEWESKPALTQKSVDVLPTRTIYTFEGAGIGLKLTFLTPALPYDIAILSRPITYVIYEAWSIDSKTHNVSLRFTASGLIAANTPDQKVTFTNEKFGNLNAVKIGSVEQPVLAKRGDDIRIDWGYLYLATPSANGLAHFESSIPSTNLYSGQLRIIEPPLRADEIRGCVHFKSIRVGSKPVTRWLMLAYDDIYSIQYMKKNLRPYWRRNGWEASDLLKASAKELDSLRKRCEEFDAEFMADLTRAGGEKYAKICALAFRQCFAAGKFVADENGQPLQFSKENHSNGCIATSDVFYPMAPQFLLFGSTLAKSFVVSFMEYAISPRWKFPFAPHDLGTYPHANGQVYGGGERTEENQMPVEESGNLLILMAAIAQIDGNAKFAERYWPKLEQWADYLLAKGFDPENQLCTDDFAGHLAHNVNLSAKAITALGAFAKLCDMRGDRDRAQHFRKVAKEFAGRWAKEAADGDHFRLAFDRETTWSQKYNLIWDRILGLNLFPQEVLRKEMDYYKKIQNDYGVPLDNRRTYTKLDWILWTATLTQNRSDFEALVNPVFRFLNETPDRSPMTDWYETKSARKVGFTARPVVGGVFAQMLYDRETWAKYASRDKTKAKNWATMPTYKAPTIVVPTARENDNIIWSYTTDKPADNWTQPDFNASSWKQGPAGFGTRMTPSSVVRTEWNSRDIWLRREINLDAKQLRDLMLVIHHDEDFELYVNGALVTKRNGYTTDYEEIPLSAAAMKALKPGRNVIAIHCHQTGGGQYIDAGFAKPAR